MTTGPTRTVRRSPAKCACVGLFLALLALAGCSERAAKTVDPRIADAMRPLLMVTHATEPPRSYTNAAGECVGTDVVLGRAIAAKLGRRLVCESHEFEELIPLLKAGKADLAISTITITEARARDVDFSRPYHTSGCCFLYRKDGPKPYLSRISTLRVGAEPGTVEDLYLCRHGGNPLRYPHIGDAFEALLKGDVDAICFDEPPLRELSNKSGGRLAVSSLITRDEYGVAVDKRRPDVLAAANAVIAERGAK